MNYKELTTLLIKIAGAVLIIYELFGIPTFVSYYFSLRLEEESVITFFLMSVLPLVIPLLAGVVMILFPATLANKIVRTSEEIKTNEEFTSSFQLVAFGVLGFYLLFNVISDFVYNFTYLYQIDGLTNKDNPLIIDAYARIVATVAELIFALYLLFGTKSLVALLNRVRKLGTN